MSDIENLNDYRPDDYWLKEARKHVPKEMEFSFSKLENESDDRIAFARFFNLIHRMHESGIAIEDIFVGGLRALMSKSIDLCSDDHSYSMYKRAHDEITRIDDTPCYHKLEIDDIT